MNLRDFAPLTSKHPMLAFYGVGLPLTVIGWKYFPAALIEAAAFVGMVQALGFVGFCFLAHVEAHFAEVAAPDEQPTKESGD